MDKGASKAEYTLAFITEAAAEYRESPFRSADWLAMQVLNALDGHAASTIEAATAGDSRRDGGARLDRRRERGPHSGRRPGDPAMSKENEELVERELLERLTYLIHFHIYDQADEKDVQRVIDGLAERDSFTPRDGWIIVGENYYYELRDEIAALEASPPRQQSMESVVEALRAARDHIHAMQHQARQYIETSGYTSFDRKRIAFNFDQQAQDSLFVEDMIYLLDGPEQRDVEAKIDAALATLPTAPTASVAEALNMCQHGADKGSYCGYCGGYSEGLPTAPKDKSHES